MILILHFKEEVSPKCIKPSCCFVLFLSRVHLRSPVKENKRKRRHHSQSVYRPGQEQKAADFELEELKRQLELKAMNPLTVSQSSVNSVKAEQADVSAKAEQPAQQSSASFFVSKESAPQSSASSVDADASVPFSALLSQSSQSQSSSQTGVSANQPMNDLQSIISSQSSIGNLQQPMQSQQQSMELQQSQQQQSLESQQSSMESQTQQQSQQQQSSMESQTQQQSQQEQQPLIITPQTQAAERPATPQEPIDTCNASSRPQS